MNDIENVIENDTRELKQPGHPALDVYENYSFAHTYDSTLPITEHREWVIGTIEMNQVTIIQGILSSFEAFYSNTPSINISPPKTLCCSLGEQKKYFSI